MAKVMFIKPALEVDAIWDPVRTSPYLGMWYLASTLKEKGHEVKYLDEVVRDNGLNTRVLLERELQGNKVRQIPFPGSFESVQNIKRAEYLSLDPKDFAKKYTAFPSQNAEDVRRIIARIGNSEEDTLRKVAETNPDVVGIPLIASANYITSTSLAKKIKEKFPKTRIIFGGQHISATTQEFLEENPYVDHIVSGDAVNVIDDIVEGRIASKIIYGGFQSMDKFPLLDPSILNETGYPSEPTHTFPTSGRKSVDFMFSKGCFRRCDFCVAGSQKGNYVTAEGYDLAAKQLDIFKANGIEELVLQDDAFLHDPKHRREHLTKILSLMKERGLYWQNNGGVEFEAIDDFVTEKIARYNSEGEGRVTSLYIPFNPRTWNRDKSAAKTMSQRYHSNLDNLKRLREAGIYVFTSTIIGTPDQSREAFEEELQTDKELIQAGYIDSALCLSATMLPGTKWYQENGHNIVNKHDYPGYSLFTTHHRTEFMEPTEIEECMVKWLKELDPVQKTYSWQTTFYNTPYRTGEVK